MKKIILSLMLAVFGVVMVGAPVGAVYGDNEVAEPTDSSACANKLFFGMRPWFYGLQLNGDCSISSENFKGEDNTRESIIVIILNVIHDAMMIVGVLAAGFLMFGAYRYIRGGGDVGMVMKGKKTITYALIGLVLVLLSEVIISTVGQTILSAKVTDANAADFGLFGINTNQMLQAMVNFALGLLTIVAVGFAVLSGILMITSWGDPGKLVTAKKGLATSIVGIVIAILSFALVNMVISNVMAGVGEHAADGNLFSVAQQILGVIVGICGFVAVCGIVVGGVLYMTSAGDAQKVTKGKNAIIWSVVGLAIAVLAGVIVSFVISKLV